MALDFVAEIKQALEEYGETVTEDVDRVAKEVADAAVEELKRTSPMRKGKGGGKYAKSWEATNEKKGRLQVGYTIHNKKHYRLTHLLEHGHAKRGGVGRVAAQPHIAAVEEKAVKDFEEKLMEVLENGH